MRWYLTWGNDIDFLEELQAEGQEVPALENRPYLPALEADMLEDFFALSPTRMIGFQASGISNTEILAYCELHGLPNEHRPRFAEFIRAMDAEFLAFCAEKDQG